MFSILFNLFPSILSTLDPMLSPFTPPHDRSARISPHLAAWAAGWEPGVERLESDSTGDFDLIRFVKAVPGWRNRARRSRVTRVSPAFRIRHVSDAPRGLKRGCRSELRVVRLQSSRRAGSFSANETQISVRRWCFPALIVTFARDEACAC